MPHEFPSPEAEARQLREQIYGPISQLSWEQVRANWIRDLPWLRQQTQNQNQPSATLAAAPAA